MEIVETAAVKLAHLEAAGVCLLLALAAGCSFDASGLRASPSAHPDGSDQDAAASLGFNDRDSSYDTAIPPDLPTSANGSDRFAATDGDSGLDESGGLDGGGGVDGSRRR